MRRSFSPPYATLALKAPVVCAVTCCADAFTLTFLPMKLSDEQQQQQQQREDRFFSALSVPEQELFKGKQKLHAEAVAEVDQLMKVMTFHLAVNECSPPMYQADVFGLLCDHMMWLEESTKHSKVHPSEYILSYQVIRAFLDNPYERHGPLVSFIGLLGEFLQQNLPKAEPRLASFNCMYTVDKFYPLIDFLRHMTSTPTSYQKDDGPFGWRHRLGNEAFQLLLCWMDHAYGSPPPGSKHSHLGQVHANMSHLMMQWPAHREKTFKFRLEALFCKKDAAVRWARVRDVALRVQRIAVFVCALHKRVSCPNKENTATTTTVGEKRKRDHSEKDGVCDASDPTD